MEAAQQRLERELEQSGEPQIEDEQRPEVPEGFESPKMSREDMLGREEKPVGTPKSLHPPRPEQGAAKASQVPATEKATEDVSAKPVGSTELQVSVQRAGEQSSSSQRALVPATVEIVEAKDIKPETVCQWSSTSRKRSSPSATSCSGVGVASLTNGDITDAPSLR